MQGLPNKKIKCIILVRAIRRNNVNLMSQTIVVVITTCACDTFKNCTNLLLEAV